MGLNLAQRPFVNRRPVQRISVLLWILGLVLAVTNVFLYRGYLTGQGAAQDGLQEVTAELRQESALLAEAQEELSGLQTEELNSKIEFVNLRIQQRTFSWSRLFDVLAETLPDDVRLLSLAPRFDSSGRRGRRRASTFSPDTVELQIVGQAKSSEALLAFLDRLFGHPAFQEPDLHQEQARQDSSVIDFNISTNYLPDSVDSGDPAVAQEAEQEAATGAGIETGAGAEAEADDGAQAEDEAETAE